MQGLLAALGCCRAACCCWGVAPVVETRGLGEVVYLHDAGVEKAVVVSSRVIIHTFIHYTNFAHSVTYTETSCPMQASKTAIIPKIQNASASVCSAIGKLSIGKVDDVAVRANAESSAIKSALVGGLPSLKKTVTRVTRADGSVRCSSRNASASAHV